MTKENTKFRINDKVIFVNGFYRGKVVRLTEHYTGKNYWGFCHGPINEDDVELYIPWYKQLFWR